MRIAFRNVMTAQTTRDRVLFCAPIAVALILLFLFVENRGVLASSWRDPMAMLNDRSPGERDAGALYNIKHERLQALAKRPEERVLGAARQRPELPGVLPAEAGPLDLVMADDPVPVGTEVMDANLPGIQIPPDVPLASTSRGCCIGTFATLAGVPEPTTWLMNIIGLFAIGAALRRRNRKVLGAGPLARS
jgi:hypothetical protein